MATKVTRHQIDSVNPSQLTSEGAQEGDSLVAVRNPNNGGLTLMWSPTSVLPKIALHGQVLVYNAYTAKWMASAVNAGQSTALPLGTTNDNNKVLTWNGFAWMIASPAGAVTSIKIDNTDGAIAISTPNTITSTGTITLGLNTVPLPKVNQGGATHGQVMTWNASNGTGSWAPSAVTNSVGTIRAWVMFDGTVNPVVNGILGQRNISTIVDNGAGDYTIKFVTGTFGSNTYAYSSGVALGQSGNYVGSVLELARSLSSIQITTGFVNANNEFRVFDASNISMIFVG